MCVICENSSGYIEIYIGEFSLDDFNIYTDECFDSGLNIDYSRYYSSSFGYELYQADDINGNFLEVKYYED